MNSRVTFTLRPAFARLGTDRVHRFFAKKADKSPDVAPIPSLNKQFTARTRNLVLHYINHSYSGYDERLKSCNSTMDIVQEVKAQLGPYESLNDLITKACISVKEASGLCNEISQFLKKKRRHIQLSYPAFTTEDNLKVDNILAIHTSLYCVVWTHLERSGRVLSWHKEPLYLGEKQKHTIDCVQAVMNFHDKIPIAGAYVMETPDVRRSKDVSEANNGFLLSNINCSILATISSFHKRKESRARLHYMNRVIVPKLFDLSVGLETVSRFRTVEALIDKTFPLKRLGLCGITLDDWLKDLFTASNDKTKEELSISLLAAMAAMEVLVKQNPVALDKLAIN